MSAPSPGSGPLPGEAWRRRGTPRLLFHSKDMHSHWNPNARLSLAGLAGDEGGLGWCQGQHEWAAGPPCGPDQSGTWPLMPGG